MNPSRFRPRPGYEGLAAYRSERPAVEIDLCDSTNQWGAAPSALAALRDWSERDVREYPSTDSRAFAAAAADYVGVAPENIVSACGSDDVLDAAFRALAEPGDRIAHPSPTFSMIPIRARANGLIPVSVPTLPDGDADADAMLATGARILYLCTPNNPTGIAHARQTVERVIRDAPGVVIVDEAYAEFAPDVFTADVARHDHVLSARTLSKSFGLAGLRIGYGVGDARLVNEIVKARGPYRVNAFAERAAVAALMHDRGWMQDVVAQVRDVRTRFADALRDRGFDPLRSDANFVCVPVPGAAAIAERMHSRSVAVRALPNQGAVGDVLRIGLAPWPVMERVLDALEYACQ